MSIGYSPHAVHDIDTATDYLEAERFGGGQRFQEDLRRTLQRLEQLPESAAVVEPPSPRYPGLRVAQLKKFDQYCVYDQPTDDGIRVARVLHNSRSTDAILYSDPDPPTPPGS